MARWFSPPLRDVVPTPAASQQNLAGDRDRHDGTAHDALAVEALPRG